MGLDARMKVLIVEDDEGTASLISEVLERDLLAEVSVAADGEAARRRMSDEEFDVVALDSRLPDGSGLDLLEDMTEGEDKPPVVVVNGSGHAHLFEKTSGFGASGHAVEDSRLTEELAGAVGAAFAKVELDRARRELDVERALRGFAVNELEELFCVFDPRGRLTGWNRKLVEVTGLEDRELRYAPAEKVFEGRDLALLRADGAQPGREPKRRFGLAVKTRDGDRVAHEFTTILLETSAGERVGVCAIGREASSRRRAAVSSTDAPGEAPDLSADIIMRTDRFGDVCFVNEEACRFLGKSEGELLGSSVFDLVRPEDLERIRELGKHDVIERGRRITGVVTHSETDAGWRYVEWNATPVLERGVLQGTQVTGRDITRRELTERFLRHVNLELDEYAHTVSHDLRAPLSCIMVAADTLKLLLEEGSQEQKEATVREMARIISDCSQEAGALIKNMLDLAERAQMPDGVEELDVGGIVARVGDTLAAEIDARGVSLRAPRDLGRLLASRTQVYQVFLNLIENSVRHASAAAGTVVEVRRLEGREGLHRYLVRDNGPGIPRDDLDTIFKPFVKSEGSSGRGIGLATVDKIVKSYGGYIKAYNDGGACFEFGMLDYVEGDSGSGSDPGAGA